MWLGVSLDPPTREEQEKSPELVESRREPPDLGAARASASAPAGARACPGSRDRKTSPSRIVQQPVPAPGLSSLPAVRLERPQRGDARSNREGGRCVRGVRSYR